MLALPLWATLAGFALFIALPIFRRLRPWILVFAAMSVILTILAIETRFGGTTGNACKLILLTAIVVVMVRQAQSFFRLFRPRKLFNASGPMRAAYEKHATRLSLAVAMLAGGVLLGRKTGDNLAPVLLLITGVSWIVAVQCAAAYHFFAREFAGAIYRDYWAVVSSAEPEKNSTGEPDEE